MADASPARKKRRSSANVEEEDEEGFKFSRQSRRKTYHKKLNKSASKSTEKKRRSSFVRGRKEQKSLPAPNGKTTCKLKEQENKDVITTPNPANQKLEENALSCNLVSDRLQKEDSKWEELLCLFWKLQQDVQQERLESNDKSKSKDECPDFLSPIQHKLLSGKPTIKTVLDKIEKLKQTCQLQVDSVSEAVASLKEYKDITEPYIQEQIEQFGTQNIQVIEDMGTPRTLIKGQLSPN